MNQTLSHLHSWLTCDCDIGCSLDISIETAVEAAVLQLCVFDRQLHDAVSIFHLVLEMIPQQLFSFPPLHSKAGLGQLAAQGQAVLLLHLLVP